MDEFMQIESQIEKESSIRSKKGETAVFVGDSFRDELAESVGTQMTEIIDSGKRGDDSILREEAERQSFQKRHALMNNNLFGESMQSKELKSE